MAIYSWDQNICRDYASKNKSFKFDAPVASPRPPSGYANTNKPQGLLGFQGQGDVVITERIRRNMSHEQWN